MSALFGIFHRAPAMMHSVNIEGRLVTVSDYWLNKLGYERNEVIGKKSIDFLTEKSRKDALIVYFPNFFKNGWIQAVPYQFINRDGEIIDVLLSAVSEKDVKGKIFRLFSVLIDVTEHKRIESRLLHAEKLESIGVLAGRVAHDFNNILGIILGNAELALDDIPEWHPACSFSRHGNRPLCG